MKKLISIIIVGLCIVGSLFSQNEPIGFYYDEYNECLYSSVLTVYQPSSTTFFLYEDTLLYCYVVFNKAYASEEELIHYVYKDTKAKTIGRYRKDGFKTKVEILPDLSVVIYNSLPNYKFTRR